MSIFRKELPVLDLKEWLQIATKGLCPRAERRIRQEIASHYDAAVENLTTSGVHKVEAGRRALAELGAAKTAAKRFRRQHLTGDDWHRLLAMSKNSLFVSPLFYYAFLPLAFGAWGLNFIKPDSAWSVPFVSFCIVLFGVLLLASYLNFFKAWRKTFKPGLRKLVLLEIFFNALLLLFFSRAQSGGMDWFFCLMAISPFLNFCSAIRLYFKLRHVANDWQEMPPRDGAVA